MSRVLHVDNPRLVLDCPEGVHAPGAPSLRLLRYLFSVRGKSVLDLGSGTGVFALAAAKLGAREVWATDVSPAAVDCTRANAAHNGAPVRVRAGDLFEPVGDRTFDLIVTLPPQMPAPEGACGPELAGADGLGLFEAILREAPDHLERGGELLTCLHTLADTRRFESLLSERFRYRALPAAPESFTADGVEALAPGLGRYLSERRHRGLAQFEETDGGGTCWVRSYLAMRL